MPSWLIRLGHSFSATGLLVGTLFFAASLTPSLLPRTYLMQGVLSGCSLAAGYGIGKFGLWLWRYLELPPPSARTEHIGKLLATLVFGVIALFFLWRASEWQNSIRQLMELEPVDTAHPFKIGLIALAVFVVLVALGRIFQLLFRFLSGRLRPYVPRRIAQVVGIVGAAALFWAVIDGVVFRYALRVADLSYQQVDALIEADIKQPDDPAKTGSAASLIRWDELGRAGREFVSTGPGVQDFQAFGREAALDPIRIYVGLRSAETAEERARLALEELKRVGAFDRSVLVIVSPTGTGWVDPAAMDTIEYLHGGDVASVAVQYSYLTSWLSLLVEPGYGAQASRALFSQVYGHWTTLPENARPRLYLHGLSLGALSSELSTDLFEILDDPFDGALWSGPPFPSRIWGQVKSARKPSSPAWLPRFRDGSVVRFTSQENALAIPGAEWGPLRIIYLQYASDPVTFFDPKSLYRQPDWMAAPRGPDVSLQLRWYPVVTLLQLALDMAAATTAPMGYGHVYAPEHYIDAWVSLTDPDGWNEDTIARLKHFFEDKR